MATSFDAGNSWTAQPLPGITQAQNPADIYTFASDPVVAYDARRATWLVSSMAVVTTGATGPAFVVSRSHDGVSWDVPTYGPMVAGPDKPWIACDNSPSSPYDGACYAGWENGYGDGYLYVSKSTDGALTWSPPARLVTSGFSSGIVPVIRPDGRIVAPYLDESTSTIGAFSSTDGGAT